MGESLQTIPARRGKAARLKRGQAIRIVNTHGSQVVDTWAFVDGRLTEFMSMEHSRASLLKLVPMVGDALVTNRRRPILTLVEDSSGGVHDTLIAACDPERYALLGCKEHHDNCTENLAAALGELGLAPPETPSPLNLFMHIPWTADGKLAFAEPPHRPGGAVLLRAELDTIVVMSACPQDIVPINGRACRPNEAHFQVVG